MKRIKYTDKNMAITDITYGDNSWILVFSEDHSYQEQNVVFTSTLTEEIITDEWNEGRVISRISHGDGRWVLVSHKE